MAVEPRARACLGGPPGSPGVSTVERVARLHGLGEPPRITLTTPLPPGAGYAVSAASAVASSLVLGASAGRGYVESLAVAHEAEIIESTGLGDVLAISCGVGVVLRLEPGAPGVGRAECIPVPSTLSVVAGHSGRLHTRSLLSGLDERVLEYASTALRRIESEFTVESFIYWSEWFSRRSGFLSSALGGRELPRIPGAVGVYGKKRVVVVFVEREWARDAVEALELAGLEPRILEPSPGPPRLWWA